MSMLTESGNFKRNPFSEDEKSIHKWPRLGKLSSWKTDPVLDTKISCDFSDKDINMLIDKNNQLHNQLKNLGDSIKLEKQKYYQFRNEQKKLTEEIKYMFDALKRAKKYYKDALNTYFSIVSNTDSEQIVYIQFFTAIKLSHDRFSVWLARCKKTDEYRLSKMDPVLSNYRQIEQRLEESKDVPAILCCLRLSFMKLREHSAKSQ